MVNLRPRSEKISVITKRKYTKKKQNATFDHLSNQSIATTISEPCNDIIDIYDDESQFIGPEQYNPFDNLFLNFPDLRKFREKKKKMKKNIEIKTEYKVKHILSAKAELDQYFKSICKTALMTGSVKVRCTICENCCTSKMEQSYRICKCGVEYCQLKYKINKCPMNYFWYVRECGVNIHAFEHFNLLNNLTIKHAHGMEKNVQEIIIRILEQDNDITPKKILIKLKEGVKKKRDEYKHINKSSIPKLNQLINFF